MKIKSYLYKIFKKNYNKTLIFDYTSKEKITYSSLIVSTNLLSNLINKNHLKKNSKVAVILDNSYVTVQVYFTLFLNNLVCVPINPDLISRNIKSIIADNNIKLIVTNKKYKNLLKNIKEKKDKKILLVEEFEDYVKNNFDKSNLPKPLLLKKFNKKLELINFSLPQLKIYTSGTTGNPKAVTHNYKNLFISSLAFKNFYNLNSESRFWNFLPMSYLGGYFNLLFLPIYVGGSVLISHPFNSKLLFNSVEIIKNYNLNILWFTPDIANSFKEFIRSKQDINFIKKSKIKFFIGMDYVSKNLKEEFFKKFNKYLFENYGLSETLFLSCDKSKTINESSGRILKGVKLSIKKSNKHDEFGEIVVKKNAVIKKNFYTGDLGKIKNNLLYFRSRKKDILIKGGINISPLEVENIFKKFSVISRTCLLEITNKLGQKKLILVFKINTYYKFKDYLEKIKKYSRLMIDNVKRPDYFVEINNFPITPSGKIKRSVLQKWIENKNITNDYTLKKNKNIRKINRNIKQIKPPFLSKDTFGISQASSVKLNNEVYELKNKGDKIITLSLGEAFFKIPDFSLKKLPLDKINHYSHSRGLISLRKKISNYYNKNFDYKFDPDSEILITAGSKVAIYLALKTILNKGDEVIILEPCWVSFSEQIKLCGAKPVFVPHNISVFNVKKFINKKTKAIIINSPNNPTGKIYSFEELDFLYNLSVIHNIFCISDEAYSDFMPTDQRFLSLGNFEKEKKNLIITNSLSKNFSLSGWRIGYVVASKNLINQMLKINQHLVTCAPTILQYYLAENFDRIYETTNSQIRRLLDKRNTVARYLNKYKLIFLKGESTFYFFISIEPSKLSSEIFQNLLLKKYKVAVVAGKGYGKSCDKFIRISFGTESIKKIILGLKKIRLLINETSKQ